MSDFKLTDLRERVEGASGPELKADWSANGVPSDIAHLWLEHGGDHHGPRVETVTMPMANLMGFLRALEQTPAEKEVVS